MKRKLLDANKKNKVSLNTLRQSENNIKEWVQRVDLTKKVYLDLKDSIQIIIKNKPMLKG